MQDSGRQGFRIRKSLTDCTRKWDQSKATGNDLGNRDWFWWQPGPETSPPPFRAPPPHPWGVGSLANLGEPPTRVGGVTGATGKRAGFRSGFQSAAWEADTPRLATGAYQGTIGFCLWRAVRGSARVLALTEDKGFTTKTRRTRRGRQNGLGEPGRRAVGAFPFLERWLGER